MVEYDFLVSFLGLPIYFPGDGIALGTELQSIWRWGSAKMGRVVAFKILQKSNVFLSILNRITCFNYFQIYISFNKRHWHLLLEDYLDKKNIRETVWKARRSLTKQPLLRKRSSNATMVAHHSLALLAMTKRSMSLSTCQVSQGKKKENPIPQYKGWLGRFIIPKNNGNIIPFFDSNHQLFPRSSVINRKTTSKYLAFTWSKRGYLWRRYKIILVKVTSPQGQGPRTKWTTLFRSCLQLGVLKKDPSWYGGHVMYHIYHT